MSDHYLLWVKVPPPRVARESKLMLALSAAITIYAVPVVMGDRDADTLDVDLGGEMTCCFCGHGPDFDPDPDEPDELEVRSAGEFHFDPVVDSHQTREQAIEQALSHSYNIGVVGVLGSRELFHPQFYSPPLAIEDGEFLRDDDYDAPWRVHSFPQLAAEMQPPLHTSQLSRFTILAQGSLDRRTVRRFLRRQQLELQRCYDSTPSLRLDRTLRGDDDPSVQFLIDHDGRVVQVIPYSSSPELATCLEQTVKTLTFPHSDGLTQVHVPLHVGS